MKSQVIKHSYQNRGHFRRLGVLTLAGLLGANTIVAPAAQNFPFPLAPIVRSVQELQLVAENLPVPEQPAPPAPGAPSATKAPGVRAQPQMPAAENPSVPFDHVISELELQSIGEDLPVLQQLAPPIPGETPTSTTHAEQEKPQQPVPDAKSPDHPRMPAAPPRVAADYEAPPRPLPSPERVGVDVTNQTRLTLDEAITLALQNNNDIDASREDVQMAQFDLTSARGIFDPRLSTETHYETRTTPVSSIIGGGLNGKTNQVDTSGSARLGGFTPFFGGSYQLDFSSTRLTTDNLFASLNPQYPSSLVLSYTQPLWRGLRTDDNRRRIDVAKKNLSLTDAQFRQRVIEITARVQQAYWDLTFALRFLEVQLDAVKQARLQVESNQRQVGEGVLAPIDVVAANTQVATFEQNVYIAQEAVTRWENNLKTLMLPNRGADLWSQALLPTTPVALEPPSISLEEALTNALKNRPELEQVAVSAEINQINARFFKDSTRPQINLVATYTGQGLAGSPVLSSPNPLTAGSVALTNRVNQLSGLAGLPALPPSPVGSVAEILVGGYSESLRTLLDRSFPTTRIGVQFSFPVGNRTAKANLGRSLAEGRRITNQREQLEQTIAADVRNAIQALHSGEARLSAAAVARASAEQQYTSEERRFQAGLSTVFLVLQRQTDLITMRGRELQAQTDLNRSIAEFQRVTGSTLQMNNITVRTDTPTRQLEHGLGPASK